MAGAPCRPQRFSLQFPRPTLNEGYKCGAAESLIAFLRDWAPRGEEGIDWE